MFLFEQHITQAIALYYLKLPNKSHTFPDFSIKEKISVRMCVHVPVYTYGYDGIYIYIYRIDRIP